MQKITRNGRTMGYSEILRTVGQYLDRSKLLEVRILEVDNGLIVQGRISEGARRGEIDTYELSPEDILGLIEDARSQRAEQATTERGTKL